MEKKATLFEYVYRQLVSDIEQGALRYGDALPSLHDLCDRFRVGIRTIRDVQRALKADGYIVVEERKRAVVAYRPVTRMTVASVRCWRVARWLPIATEPSNWSCPRCST